MPRPHSAPPLLLLLIALLAAGAAFGGWWIWGQVQAASQPIVQPAPARPATVATPAAPATAPDASATAPDASATAPDAALIARRERDAARRRLALVAEAVVERAYDRFPALAKELEALREAAEDDILADRLRVRLALQPRWASARGRDAAGEWAVLDLGPGTPGPRLRRLASAGRGCWIAEQELTLAQFRRAAPGLRPVRDDGQVAWTVQDAAEVAVVIKALSDLAQVPVRVPTLAEWRAIAEDPAQLEGKALDAVAWWEGTSEGVAHSVGTRLVSVHGTYDTVGNAGDLVVGDGGALVMAGGSFRSPRDEIGRLLPLASLQPGTAGLRIVIDE